MKKYIISFLLLNIVLISGIMYTPNSINKYAAYYTNLNDGTLFIYSEDGFTDSDKKTINENTDISTNIYMTNIVEYINQHYKDDTVNMQAKSIYYNPTYMNEITLTDGVQPKNKSEILISTTLAGKIKEVTNKEAIGQSYADYKIVGTFSPLAFEEYSYYNYYDSYSNPNEAILNSTYVYENSILSSDYQNDSGMDIENINEELLYRRGDGMYVNWDCDNDSCEIDLSDAYDAGVDYLLDEKDYTSGFQQYALITTKNVDKTKQDLIDINEKYYIIDNQTDYLNEIGINNFYAISFMILIFINIIVFITPVIRYIRFRRRKH